MNDKQAMMLYVLLDFYLATYGEDPTDITVKEVMDDLLESADNDDEALLEMRDSSREEVNRLG